MNLSNERQDNLWEKTCFEAFIQPMDSKQYWEINVSPSGQWNVYHFQDRRQSMKPESRMRVVKSQFQSLSSSSFSFQFEVDLSQALSNSPATEVRVGLCTILLHKDSTKSHWALAHKSPQADFHDPQSFLLSTAI